MLYLDWKKLLFIPVVLIINSLHVFGQVPGEFERAIEFNGEDAKETIIIEVDRDVLSLSAVLRGEITTGSLAVSFVDPAGKKRNAFSLDCAQSGDGHYEVHSISSGAVVSVVKEEKGKSHVIAETEEGGKTKSVIITSEETGPGSVMQIVSGDEKFKVKTKGKQKVKKGSHHSGSGSNANPDDGQNGVVVTTKDDTGAKGVFVESIEDPEPGNWKVVVEGKKTTGSLNVVINKS